MQQLVQAKHHELPLEQRECPLCGHRWMDKYRKDECPKCVHKLSQSMRLHANGGTKREPGEVSTYKYAPGSAMVSEYGRCKKGGGSHLWKYGRCLKCGIGEGTSLVQHHAVQRRRRDDPLSFTPGVGPIVPVSPELTRAVAAYETLERRAAASAAAELAREAKEFDRAAEWELKYGTVRPDPPPTVGASHGSPLKERQLGARLHRSDTLYDLATAGRNDLHDWARQSVDAPSPGVRQTPEERRAAPLPFYSASLDELNVSAVHPRPFACGKRSASSASALKSNVVAARVRPASAARLETRKSTQKLREALETERHALVYGQRQSDVAPPPIQIPLTHVTEAGAFVGGVLGVDGHDDVEQRAAGSFAAEDRHEQQLARAATARRVTAAKQTEWEDAQKIVRKEAGRPFGDATWRTYGAMWLKARREAAEEAAAAEKAAEQLVADAASAMEEMAVVAEAAIRTQQLRKTAASARAARGAYPYL